MEGTCQALCRTLVSQKAIQRETGDISQSVLYTSLMGLLLVADKEVGKHLSMSFEGPLLDIVYSTICPWRHLALNVAMVWHIMHSSILS